MAWNLPSVLYEWEPVQKISHISLFHIVCWGKINWAYSSFSYLCLADLEHYHLVGCSYCPLFCGSSFLLPLWRIFCHFFSVQFLVGLFMFSMGCLIFWISPHQHTSVLLWLCILFCWLPQPDLCTSIFLPRVCIYVWLVYNFLCIAGYCGSIPYRCPGISLLVVHIYYTPIPNILLFFSSMPSFLFPLGFSSQNVKSSSYICPVSSMYSETPEYNNN